MDKLEKIIEIPEGYEARIEGNKVVLEQKESEDEKIRKEMINFISQIKALSEHGCRCGWDTRKEDAPKYERFIAYLEKQKEHTFFPEIEDEINHWVGYNAFPEGTTITPLPKAIETVKATARYFYSLGLEKQKNEPSSGGFWEGYKCGRKKAESQIRKGMIEQNPAERVEINKSLSDVVVAELGKYNGENYWKAPWAIDSTGLQYPLYFATLGATWQKEQKPAEWNPTNEDVILFNKAITTNTSLTPAERAKLDIIRMKFKHCNGNVAKSAEWSEEDKEMIKDIIDLLDTNLAASDFHEIENWLNSLPERFSLQPKQEWSKENKK